MKQAQFDWACFLSALPARPKVWGQRRETVSEIADGLLAHQSVRGPVLLSVLRSMPARVMSG